MAIFKFWKYPSGERVWGECPAVTLSSRSRAWGKSFLSLCFSFILPPKSHWKTLRSSENMRIILAVWSLLLLPPLTNLHILLALNA